MISIKKYTKYLEHGTELHIGCHSSGHSGRNWKTNASFRNDLHDLLLLTTNKSIFYSLQISDNHWEIILRNEEERFLFLWKEFCTNFSQRILTSKYLIDIGHFLKRYIIPQSRLILGWWLFSQSVRIQSRSFFDAGHDSSRAVCVWLFSFFPSRL